MEPFEVRVRRWVEMSHEFLRRIATDARCPSEVQAEAQRLQVMCEHLGDPSPDAATPYPRLTEAQKARVLDEFAQEYALDNLRPVQHDTEKEIPDADHPPRR